MSQQKNKVVGIGHNSNDTMLTEKLLKVSKTLEDIFHSLSQTYGKHNAAMGDTYAFNKYDGTGECDVRKATPFEKNRLHFEAQQEQEKCINQIREIKEVLNGKK